MIKFFLLIIFLISLYFFYNYINKKNYLIKEFPNFLTSDECDYIIKNSQDNLIESKVYTSNQDILLLENRKSEQTWLKDYDPNINNITQKIRKITNTYTNIYEDLQVVRYQEGGFFISHYDACNDSPSACERMNYNIGPRLYTFLIYLNDDFEGGETIFPKLNISIKPEKGKAILFKNIDDNGIIINDSLHGSLPIKSGNKWIANKWIRYNKI